MVQVTRSCTVRSMILGSHFS